MQVSTGIRTGLTTLMLDGYGGKVKSKEKSSWGGDDEHGRETRETTKTHKTQ